MAGAILLVTLLAMGQDSGRIRPPLMSCDRNHLTVYAGRVLSLERRTDRTVIIIRTDENTTESVTLQHKGTHDPTMFFRIGGRAFQEADWARIESSPKHLREGQRAAAWVCDSGEVLVDWKVSTAETPGATSPPR